MREGTGARRSGRVTSSLGVTVLLVAIAVGVIGYVLTRQPVARGQTLYDSARATVTFDNASQTALELTGQGALRNDPTELLFTWTNDDGWYLNLNGPVTHANGSLQHDGTDFHGWAGLDAPTCTIGLDEVTTTRIVGSIRCRGLVWYDKSSVENVKPLERPAFDIDVAFEAAGTGTPPASIP